MGSIMENLELFLITYNRKEKLRRTLEAILKSNSPVRGFPLTVLDNASTDGSSEMLAELAATHSNIRHIRHTKNIGGNANIARAFEMASAEYVWVLCDDDDYDFSAWDEVVELLRQKPIAVVVASYLLPSKETEYLFRQLSFVPAAIYRTDIITSDVVQNMYFNIAYMFPQLAVAAAAINCGKSLPVLSKPLVTMCLNPGHDSYTRGMSQEAVIHPLWKEMFWQKGYLASISLLASRTDRERCSLLAHTEPESFYGFCGRFMQYDKDWLYTYATAVHLLYGKAKIAFAFLAPLSLLCSFWRDEKGLNIRLFGRIKTRIWKYKNN